MQITERQRQKLETALDAALLCVTRGVTIGNRNVDDMLRSAAAIVREVPKGQRRVRTDAGTKREQARGIE